MVVQRMHDSILHDENYSNDPLIENNDYPPADHAVVDCHITTGRCYMTYRVTYTSGRRDFGNVKFVLHAYQVGPFANVFLLWPLGWPPPAPNRFGYLPKAEFADNPGSNAPRSSYPAEITFTYKTITGEMFTPPKPFVG